MPAQIGDRFVHPRTGTSMEVIARDPLVVRRTIKPGNGRLKAHYSLDYVERFVIESGTAEARLDGKRLELGPGDQMVVPARRSHVNPYNRGSEDLVYTQSAEPTPAFIEAFVQTYGNCLAAGKTDRQDEIPLMAAFAAAHLTDSDTYATGAPRFLQKKLLAPLGAAIARRRGLPVAG
jgi:mannose-6-phosphate isomerase-like protein (cupin superfamily)